VLKLSYNVSDVFPKVLKLRSEVSECKPLPCSLSGLFSAAASQGRATLHVSPQLTRVFWVPSWNQGLTLVHVRAAFEQQDTFMIEFGLYGGQRSSS